MAADRCGEGVYSDEPTPRADTGDQRFRQGQPLARFKFDFVGQVDQTVSHVEHLLMYRFAKRRPGMGKWTIHFIAGAMDTTSVNADTETVVTLRFHNQGSV